MADAAAMADIPIALNDTFDDVVREREVSILRTAYRMLGNWADAEDVAQEVFVRLHRHGLSFPTAAALNAWLYRVAVNLCLDRTRSSRPRGELRDISDGSESAETAAIRSEQGRRLMTALGRLPARERAVIVLREIEGLSTAEVAEVFGSTETTVRSQISKAMARLRTMLSEDSR
jgi:RNA polymerase sigma-70 factor, ECF subfamily